VGAVEALGGLQQNVLGSAVWIAEHVRIPQANDTPTVFSEIRRPSLIMRRTIDVLAPVELDGQPGAAAREIDDKRCNNKLPGEGRTIPRNAMPDHEFGGRWIVAQLARPSRQFRIDATAHGASVSWLAALANPPPAPPLQGGESLRLPRMVEVVDLLRDRGGHARRFLEIVEARPTHRPRGAEMHQQRLLARRADAGNLVER